jgi:hypothetical protein
MSFRRINFFRGLFMRAEDWKTEQNYHIEKQRLHTRAFHSPGVVREFDNSSKESLKVSLLDTGAIVVQPGYAVDARGRDLCLPDVKELSLPTSTGTVDKDMFIYIAFHEEETDPRESRLNPADRGNAVMAESVKVGWADEPPDNLERIELARVQSRAGRRFTREHIDSSHVKFSGAGQAGVRVLSGTIEITPTKTPQFTSEDPKFLIEAFSDGQGLPATIYLANVIPWAGRKRVPARIQWRVESSLPDAGGLQYHLYIKNFGTEPVDVKYEVFRLNFGSLG